MPAILPPARAGMCRQIFTSSSQPTTGTTWPAQGSFIHARIPVGVLIRNLEAFGALVSVSSRP